MTDGLSRDKSGDVLPFGSRKAFAAQVHALVEMHGDLVRERLVAPDVVDDFCTTIHEGIQPYSKTGRPPDRTCLNQYAVITKLLGEQDKVVNNFFIRFGVKTEGELAAKVSLAQSIEGMTADEGAERCEAFLEAFYNTKLPERRQAGIRRLGGYVPV